MFTLVPYDFNICFIFLSCGDFNGNHLAKEAGVKNVKLPSYLKRWINIKKVFPAQKYKWKKSIGGMTDMLKVLGLKLDGRHHSGIDDARNIAKCVLKLMKDGFVFDATMIRS